MVMLANLISAEELRAEQMLAKLNAVVHGKVGVGWVDRIDNVPLFNNDCVSVQIGADKVRLGVSGNTDILDLIAHLARAAKQGKLTFIDGDEVAGPDVPLKTRAGERYSIAFQRTEEGEIPNHDSSPAYVRLRLCLLSQKEDYSEFLLDIGEQVFTANFFYDNIFLKVRLEEQHMDQNQITVQAVIGSIKVPLEDVIRVRAGTELSLGPIESLDAIFQIEGHPYATGKLIVKEDGSLLVKMESLI